MLNEYFEKNNVFKKCCAFAYFYIIFHTVLNIKNLFSVYLSLEELFFFNEKKDVAKAISEILSISLPYQMYGIHSRLGHTLGKKNG